jgi:hypothetical protein
MRRPFAFALFALTSCGPSLQAMQRSSTFYEQCYAIDASVDERHGRKVQCWNEWVADYSEGQPLSRIRFARTRVATLSVGTDEGIDLRTPANVAMTPPTDEPAMYASFEERAANLPVTDPTTCLGTCNARAQTCTGACPSTGDDIAPCRIACGAERRVCLHACD